MTDRNTRRATALLAAVSSLAIASPAFAAQVGAELPLTERLAAVVGAAVDMRRYDAPDALFLTKRNDERLDVSAGLKFALIDNLFFQPRATWTRNWSNIPLYDFDRWTVSAGVRFEF